MMWLLNVNGGLRGTDIAIRGMMHGAVKGITMEVEVNLGGGRTTAMIGPVGQIQGMMEPCTVIVGDLGIVHGGLQTRLAGLHPYQPLLATLHPHPWL